MTPYSLIPQRLLSHLAHGVRRLERGRLEADRPLVRTGRARPAVRLAAATLMGTCLALSVVHPGWAQEKPEPLRALLVTGGCCHDYPRQIQIITKGLSQRVNVTWNVFLGGDSRGERPAIYQGPDWADGYSVVVHNECYGSVDDVEFVERIVHAHKEKGIPAVVIHCSMHSYRAAATDEWRKLLGVTSRRHERGGRRLDVRNVASDHPIMRAFPSQWRTPNGELYVIEKEWPECTPLAVAYGQDTQQDQLVIWTNTYGNARVFGTTLGHHNETMLSDEWLDVVSRGLLWACDRLTSEGTPSPGYEGTGEAPLVFEELRPQSTGQPTPAEP